jgi:hypothetical protein
VKKKDNAETVRAQRIREEKRKRTGLKTIHYKEEDYD